VKGLLAEQTCPPESVGRHSYASPSTGIDGIGFATCGFAICQEPEEPPKLEKRVTGLI